MEENKTDKKKGVGIGVIFLKIILVCIVILGCFILGSLCGLTHYYKGSNCMPSHKSPEINPNYDIIN